MKIKFILYTFQKNLTITEQGKSHYVFLKDFNRLMFSRAKHKDKRHYCMSCLQSFITEEILTKNNTY